MPFGKKTEEGDVLVAPNFVDSPTVSLRAETHEAHSYPQDGWYWFATAKDAYDFFGVPMPTEDDPLMEG